MAKVAALVQDRLDVTDVVNCGRGRERWKQPDGQPEDDDVIANHAQHYIAQAATLIRLGR